MRDRVAVAAGKFLIHRNDRPGILRSLRRYKNIHLAARNAGGDRLLYRILGKKEITRQPDRTVQIAVVHAFQLNGDLLTLYGALGASVTGHTEQFSHFFPSPQICESKCYQQQQINGAQPPEVAISAMHGQNAPQSSVFIPTALPPANGPFA